MRCAIIKVMLWKHFIEKKRRFIYSFIEIVLPVLILYLILYLWVHDITESENESESTLYDPESYISKRSSPNRLFYYPDTKLTDELMNSVAKKLGMTTTIWLNSDTGVYPISNISMINQLIPELHKEDCIIHFKDMSGDEWPDKLKYTIQMRKDLNGHLSRASYKQFMRLQLAVDTSFIEMLTGKPLDVALQEVPLAPDSSEKPTDLVMGLQLGLLLAMIIPFVFTVTKLNSERSLGVEALMQIAGVSLKELYCGHALNILPSGLSFSIIATIISKFGWSLLPKANAFIIFIFFVLHYTSIICGAVAFSYILGSGQSATTLASFGYILVTIPAHMLFHKVTLPKGFWVPAGLLFQHPTYTFWYQTFQLDNKDLTGLTFNTILKSSRKYCSVFLSLMNLVIQIILLIILAWYLSQVRPGEHGFPLPWNFVCTKKYWKKPTAITIVEPREREIPEMYRQYFEPPSTQLEAGVKVVNVTKEFGTAKALDRVTLNIYKEEITVLLGHNGAGKTTLMSIITSMIVPTSGKVFLNGIDITDKGTRNAVNIGYCPQHNVNFPNLTVLEHAKLFSLLRGAKMKEAHAMSLNLLAKVNLESKANIKVSKLSGGMQRRLQLVCALSGSPNILILDEPTSGLDVETRRELWDILLAFRGHHTILLATHFMEEADALGDRIAALHAGELRCNATPMFLKKAIGTGYKLNIRTIGKPNQEEITQTITSVIPEASLKERMLNSLIYTLPATKSNSFPQLFEALEGQKSKLKIDGIGLGGTSLEDVFIKLCSDTDTQEEDERDTIGLHKSVFLYTLISNSFLKYKYNLDSIKIKVGN